MGSNDLCCTEHTSSAGITHLTSGGKELHEIAVIDFRNVCIFTFHIYFDPLGSPDTHTLGFQLGQLNTAGVVGKDRGGFFQNIFLFPEKVSGPLNGYAPGFFFQHGYHPVFILQQLAVKRKMEKY